MLKILLRLLAIGGFIYLSQDNTFLWWFNAKINTAHTRYILVHLCFVITVFCFYVFDVAYLDNFWEDMCVAYNKGKSIFFHILKFLFVVFPFMLMPFVLSYVYFVVLSTLTVLRAYNGLLVTILVWFISFFLLFGLYCYLRHSAGGKEIVSSIERMNKYHKFWFFMMQFSLGLFVFSEFIQDIIFHFSLSH